MWILWNESKEKVTMWILTVPKGKNHFIEKEDQTLCGLSRSRYPQVDLISDKEAKDSGVKVTCGNCRVALRNKIKVLRKQNEITCTRCKATYQKGAKHATEDARGNALCPGCAAAALGGYYRPPVRAQ
jgi:hypothetical protein